MKSPSSIILLLLTLLLSISNVWGLSPWPLSSSRELSSIRRIACPSRCKETSFLLRSPLPCTPQSLLSALQANASPQQSDNDSTTKVAPPFVPWTFSPLVGALCVLLAIVLFHESGHYLTARFFGIHPEEFSIGFGPKITSAELFDDTFNLRILPFGGYVKFAPDILLPLPWPKRVVISSAGVVMNLILSIGIYWREIVWGNGLVRPVLAPGIFVSSVTKEVMNKPSLRPGDVVLKINNKSTTDLSTQSSVKVEQSITNMIQLIQSTPQGEPVELVIQRNNQEMCVSVEPTRSTPDAPPTIGVYLEPNVVELEMIKSDSLTQAATLAVEYTLFLLLETALGIRSFLSDTVSFRKSPYQIRGPVGVLERATEVVSTRNVDSVFQYAAGISINFAAVNLIPIPPTDGFQIVLTLIEALQKSV